MAGVSCKYWGINLTPVFTYARDPGAMPFGAVENVQEVEDRQECVNTVLVQGRDQYGKPLYAVMQDSASVNIPGAALYVGYPVYEVIIDENLTTQAAVNYACYQHFMNRKAGYPKRTIPSHTNNAWLVIPNQVVQLINSLGNGTENVRVTKVSEVYPGHQRSYLVTLTGEVMLEVRLGDDGTDRTDRTYDDGGNGR